jgi:hypothetical protein
MRGICHRCWRESELRKDWPVSSYCYDVTIEQTGGKYGDIYIPPKDDNFTFHMVHGSIGCFNFLPVHQHYRNTKQLRWKVENGGSLPGELDLAINLMAAAWPPTTINRLGSGECTVPHVKLHGGSIISQDIWNLHHFFRAEFLEKMPYEGGQIPLVDIYFWIKRMTRNGPLDVAQL